LDTESQTWASDPGAAGRYTSLVAPSQLLLSRFGFPLSRLYWLRVGGGFSGAEVWRGDDTDGPQCVLKAWPTGFPPGRLETIHLWIERAKHLACVPTLFHAADGGTIVDCSDRLWDASRWMPGSARERPTIQEIEAACASVAELHAAWRGESAHKPAPGVRNRLQLVRDWLAAPSAPASTVPSPIDRALMDRAAEVIARAAPGALQALELWENTPLRCQPCLRDLRAEHVLFTNGRVTGLVDYGAMAIDSPAVDLARLLGDYGEESDQVFETGLRAYRGAGGNLEISSEFLAQLSFTGAVGSAINWLRRLQRPDSMPVQSEAVAARLQRILHRIERFAPA
jgi:phosphotransferase family enzyme